MSHFSLHSFGGGRRESIPLLKINGDISTKPKGIESSGVPQQTTVQSSALTDWLRVEEVTSLVNMTN